MTLDYMASFRDATELLGLPSPELGRIFGVAPQTIRQMRLPPTKKGHRSPPPGWEKVLAPLVEKRIQELQALAEELNEAA